MEKKIDHPKMIDVIRDGDGRIEFVIRNHYPKNHEKTLEESITDWPCLQCPNWDCGDCP